MIDGKTEILTPRVFGIILLRFLKKLAILCFNLSNWWDEYTLLWITAIQVLVMWRVF